MSMVLTFFLSHLSCATHHDACRWRSSLCSPTSASANFCPGPSQKTALQRGKGRKCCCWGSVFKFTTNKNLLAGH